MRKEQYLKLTIGSDEPLTMRQRALAFAGLAVLAFAAICVVLLVTVGVRPDLDTAITSGAVIGKIAFCLVLALACTLMLYGAIQPNGHVIWYLLLVPLTLLVASAAWSMVETPPEKWGPMIFDGRGRFCLLYINMLALPGFIILTQAVRLFAPRDLVTAGALTGLAAGAMGAFAFALRCGHDYSLWLLVFFVPAVAITGWIGSKIGPVVLK